MTRKKMTLNTSMSFLRKEESLPLKRQKISPRNIMKITKYYYIILMI